MYRTHTAILIVILIIVVAVGGCASVRIPAAAEHSLADLGFHARPLRFNDRLMNVAWMTRDTIYVTRHQWDTLRVDPQSHSIEAMYGDRPVTVRLLAGGEGQGQEFDWVLAGISPARGSGPRAARLDATYLPQPGDLIAVQTWSIESIELGPLGVAEASSPYQALGHITRVEDDGHALGSYEHQRSPAGCRIHARLLMSAAKRGWSGSPAFVWDAAESAWKYLGIAITARLPLADAHGGGPSNHPVSDRITILRPPLWTFDLIPADVPGVTMPGGPVESPSSAHP